MTKPLHSRAPGLSPSPDAAAARSQPMATRLMQLIGADPRFAEAVLGDLAEEYSLRITRDGVAAACLWYGRELLRSAPHFLRSWLRYASKYERARLTAVLGGLLLTLLLVPILLLYRDGPPAHIAAGTADVVIVNYERSVQLPVHVFDAAGHVLKSNGVQFRRVAGARVPISASGQITCKETGDTHVRISLGVLARDIIIRCRPIHELDGMIGGDFVAGDLPARLSISALGPDSTPVELIAVRAAVADSNIASLNGLILQPKSPGTTWMSVRAGDQWLKSWVYVHKRADSPHALRVDEGFATVLRLRGGDVQRWSIPYGGLYDISLTPMPETSSNTDRPYGDESLVDPDTRREPSLAVTNANCVTWGHRQSYRCVALNNSEVIVRTPSGAPRTDEFTGHLTVFRREN